jgi:hypothetical protein
MTLIGQVTTFSYFFTDLCWGNFESGIVILETDGPLRRSTLEDAKDDGGMSTGRNKMPDFDDVSLV